MNQYFKFVLVPAAVVIILTCFIVPNPSKDNLKEYISKALASGNDRIAEKEYKNLVKTDVNNIEYHRGYISVHYSLPKVISHGRYGSTERDDSEILNYYTVLANDIEPNIADIGRYCLGYIKSNENDNKGAIDQYLKVHNSDLPFLNNSIGRCYKKLGDPEKAKLFLKREIELGTNVEGALNNLCDIFLHERNTEQLHALIDNPAYAGKISLGFKRKVAFIEGDFIAYLAAILGFYKEYFVIDGIIAAILICAIWLLFIKRLDIFEPENFFFLILTLFISALCSEFTLFLYDFLHITLGFEMGNSPLHQLAYCVFCIGLNEEFIKLVPVFIILFFTKQINESTDYIIYASVSALGFAFMENIAYFDRSGLSHIAGRAVTSTLFHIALSSFAIYGLVYAKYKKKSILFFALSFFIACSLHGLFDFFLVVKGPLSDLRILSTFLLLFSIPCYATIFRNVLSNSEFFTLIDREPLFRYNAFLLVCGLSYVIVVQYLFLAFRFGPVFANRSFEINIIGSFFIIIITYSRFAGIKLSKASWKSVFKESFPKGKKRHLASSDDPAKPVQSKSQV
jgi:RsiW-degrading membrane proteinase PrsW (M82 family)